MIQTLKNILGIGPKVDLADLISKGAQVIDVRSRGEYGSGHLKGSVNIPLDQLHGQLKKLKGKDHPIITCCASGMRSSAAAAALNKAGIEAYNGGPWSSLQQAIR